MKSTDMVEVDEKMICQGDSRVEWNASGIGFERNMDEWGCRLRMRAWCEGIW